MKIALVNLWGVNNSYGGTEKVFFEMANALNQKGHSVTAITHDTSSGRPVFHIEKEVTYKNCGETLFEKIFHHDFWAKLKTCFIRDRQKRRIKRCTFEAQAKSSSIARAIEETKPDVIISFQQETTYLLLDVLKIKIPVITMFHSSPREYFNKPEFSLYKSSIENCACLQVLMPEYVEESLRFVSPKKIVHIPNVVPQYSEQSSLNSPVIINVGRIATEKRQHLIVEAFSKLVKQYSDWKIELWGPFAEKSAYVKQLRQLICNLNLQTHVSLCGTTNNVSEKLKGASIFLFPSAFEGFSLALTEAMSIGLPAIGCRSCPSVNSLIKDGVNGVLCEDSADDIALKLEELMKDFELRKRFGHKAKLDMKEYSAEKVWQQWEKLLFTVQEKDDTGAQA